ncbi:hypothetical protein E2C01_061098 [Portunus trituberculatus]|uniref:Uncharacterized protein n=1 Tax=Portunus trituberculatus TaxID=210409 RepID=A0A5B7HAS8_PORTR|nr:hypothetical protein [Portunus trituberculatus]
MSSAACIHARHAAVRVQKGKGITGVGEERSEGEKGDSTQSDVRDNYSDWLACLCSRWVAVVVARLVTRSTNVTHRPTHTPLITQIVLFASYPPPTRQDRIIYLR